MMQFLRYVQTYFMSIAVILGTGILGLPTSMADSGFYPFVITFSLVFLTQAFFVYCYADAIFEAAVMKQLNETRSRSNSDDNELTGLRKDVAKIDDAADEDSSRTVDESKTAEVSIHTLADCFLTLWMRICFLAIFMTEKTLLMTSYSLAGSQAFSEVIRISAKVVLPFFFWSLSIAVLVALRLMQPIVSVLTSLKGIALIFTVGVSLAAAIIVDHPISNNFQYIGDSLLMGSVTLGGVASIMPFLFNSYKLQYRETVLFARSVCLGLFTCFVLNVIWCWSVLSVVPQTLGYCNNSTRLSNAPFHWCSLNVSLKQSQQRGEISTIPLTEVLIAVMPELHWVASLIQVFIMLSTTISFTCQAVALHHTVSDIMQCYLQRRPFFIRYTVGVSEFYRRILDRAIENSASILLLLVAFVVALSFPSGLLIIMERILSFVINFQMGLFNYWIILKAFQHIQHRLGGTERDVSADMSCDLHKPAAQVTPASLRWCIHLLPVFYSFLCLYDLVTSGIALFGPSTAHSSA